MNSPPFSKNHNFLPSQTTPLSDFLYSYEKKDEENTNKENLDPFNKLITPLKSKSKNLHNSSSRNLNRSPLQDITPPLASKKNKETQIRMCYSGASEEKLQENFGYNLKFLR